VTVFVADISSYQAGLRIADLQAAGYSAVIVKCTEAGGYVNPYFAGWVDEALALNFPVASYHFVHPGNYDAQAANIHRVDPPPIPIWLDTEAGATRDDAYAIADRLRALGQTLAGIYFGAKPEAGYGGWWRADYLSNPAGTITGVYAAHGGDSNPQWIGEDLWQYGSRIAIPGHANLDASAFRGTLDQMLAHGWFQHRSIDPITITKGDTDMIVAAQSATNVVVIAGSQVIPIPAGEAPYWCKLTGQDPAALPGVGSTMLGRLATVDVAALTTALAGPLAAAVAADLPSSPAGTLTAAQVEAAAEQAVRTVLHGA